MRSKEFLMCVFVVAAVGLLAAPVAAQDPVPFECTTNGGANWTVSTWGPCSVSCSPADWTDGFCNSGSDCTGIEYDVTSNFGASADHVFTLIRDVGLDGTNFHGDEGTVYPPCAGDDLLGGGALMCHEQAIKMDPDNNVNDAFRIVVEGKYVPTWTSVYFKKGRKITESCRIPGLGSDSSLFSGSCVPSCGNFNENQTITKTEILDFKGCKLVFQFDLSTGAIVDVYEPLDNSNPAACEFVEFEVGDISLTVPHEDELGGFSTMIATFGDGFISAGDNSCSCRVFAGRVYCWGSPCPEFTR